MIALRQAVSHLWFGSLVNVWYTLAESAAYGFIGSAAAWLALTWIDRSVAWQEQAANASLEQIHQRLLSIQEISREVASATDPVELLELAARAPVQLIGAVGSSIATFDNQTERLKLEMTWGLSDAYVQSLRRRVETGVPSDRCRGCQPLTARVTGDCPLFQGLQAQARADGVASLVCLPITRERERVGILNAYFASPDGPPETQLHMLNIVATEIVTALEGVFLRARQMAALSTVEQVTQRSAGLGAFLTQVLQAVLAGWGIEAGAIFLYETISGTWHSHAHQGLGDDPADPRFDLAVRLVEEARASGRPAIGAPTATVGNPTFASAVAVPLLVEGETLGALFLASLRTEMLNPRQMPFVTLIANQTALAVRNAQLHLQLGHLAILEERLRLSREMHDGLAQTLGYLGLQVERLETSLAAGRVDRASEELGALRRAVREAYLDVREAIDGLRLSVGHPRGFVAALREYANDFAARSNIVAEVVTDAETLALPPVAEAQLLRITQEALTNVRKHSGARRAWIQLRSIAEGSEIELTIADDGRGFDPLRPSERRHWGLATMRERAESLGGQLTIATSAGQGTRISVRASLREINR
jgi:signal transduction histidine kinase